MKNSKTNKRNRKWIISWNNYPPTLSLEKLQNKLIEFAKVDYLILGFEEGEKEHTKHIQGYVKFKNPQYFNSVRNILKNEDNTYGYIEEARGDDIDNRNYCCKQGNYIEYGRWNAKEEQCENLTEIFDDIINDLDYLEICKKYHKYVLYHYRDFVKLYNDIKNNIIMKKYEEKEKKNIDNAKELCENLEIDTDTK